MGPFNIYLVPGLGFQVSHFFPYAGIWSVAIWLHLYIKVEVTMNVSEMNISVYILRILFLVSLINTLVLILDPEEGTHKDGE